ncbi:transposase, partial [Arsukibacterium sp. MJ3]|uniref:IS4 family transposase n=1 Tax=Arsukibacterium sp. MJ3 TaxID=1632859 RepID=UPI000626FDAC
MHKVRRLSLFAAIESTINGGVLSVTGLGRNIDNAAHEKHRIKRVDRLCSNVNLQQEIPLVYSKMCAVIVGQHRQPIIHVDWSDMDARKQHFLIRASIAAQGRSLTLYEEIHPLSLKEKPTIHRLFMQKLKAMLPKECRPIIVTDAGFRIPWFTLIESLGWDYVGRVRNRTFCKKKSDTAWLPVKSLYQLGTLRPKDLGQYQQGMQQSFESRMVVVWRKSKGRKDKTATGESARRSKKSRACAERETEPWLLATSLNKTRQLSKKVVKIYATRMQIEESFRDLKTGLKMNNCGTRNSPRLKVLLLVALVAQYLLFLLGLAVKSSGKHRRYQANSIKNRNVLSNQFIGLRAYKDKQLKLLKKHWQAAIDKLRTLIDDPQASF